MNVSDGVWLNVLRRLPKIISKYRGAARIEKSNCNKSDIRNFCSDTYDYFNRAVDNMSCNEKYPLKCPHCDLSLQIDCDPSDGFDFGDHSIKGYRFFECPECKKAIDKGLFIKSMRSILLNWVNVMDWQWEYFGCGFEKRKWWDDVSSDESQVTEGQVTEESRDGSERSYESSSDSSNGNGYTRRGFREKEEQFGCWLLVCWLVGCCLRFERGRAEKERSREKQREVC